MDLVSSPAEVIDSGAPGAPGGESAGGGAAVSGLSVDMLRELIANEVRSATSHVAPPPPQPQQMSSQGRFGESVGGRVGTENSLNALTRVSSGENHVSSGISGEAASKLTRVPIITC